MKNKLLSLADIRPLLPLYRNQLLGLHYCMIKNVSFKCANFVLLIFLPCQVSFDGVIGFDNPSLGECGTDSTRLADKFIAVYWLPNTDGLVTFFEANAASRQFEKDKANLMNDINKAFNMNPVNIEEKDIEHVLYVTWNSMRNSQNFQAQVRKNYDNIRNENI